MPGRIPDNILEDILSRVDIVEIISGYIPLKRAGRNFRAHCPFHHEKTPSFMVSADRQIYHCFGCGAGGNAFGFMMQYERLEFPEAVEILAKKSGVILPQVALQDSQATSLATQVYKANELAALFFEQNLNSPAAQGAKNYLLKRGLKETTLKAFKLGYALDKWDGLITVLRQKNISLSMLEKAGLILAKDGGGYFDRFRKRIIFPIFDIKARVLGFGGRLLEEDKSLAKYVNSPETPVYTKGRNLYGLNLTKDAIRQKDYAVIVEGYLDFIMPYQAGIDNIVASLGTALTYEQARLLKRYTHNIVMVYDPDDAGEAATLRTLDIFIEEGMNVKVVSLPEGCDPDLFVRKYGIDKFKDKLATAEELMQYKLKILKSRYNHKEIEGKARISAEMLSTINKFKNAVLKSEHIRKLAEQLQVKEDALLEEIKKVKDPAGNWNYNTVSKKSLDIHPTEKLLINLMLREKELISRIKQNLEPADFQDERTAKFVSVIFDLFEQGKDIEPSSLVNYLDEETMAQFICASAFNAEASLENKEKVINDCVRRLKDKRVTQMKHHLHEQIKIAEDLGDENKLNRLRGEFHNLIKKG